MKFVRVEMLYELTIGNLWRYVGWGHECGYMLGSASQWGLILILGQMLEEGWRGSHSCWRPNSDWSQDRWLLMCGWLWAWAFVGNGLLLSNLGTFQTSIDLKFSNWSMLIEVNSTWLGSCYMLVCCRNTNWIGKLHSPGNTILEIIPLFALERILVLGGLRHHGWESLTNTRHYEKMFHFGSIVHIWPSIWSILHPTCVQKPILIFTIIY